MLTTHLLCTEIRIQFRKGVKMEVPEILIEQCKTAYPLIKYKQHHGFNEGDYIWDGKKVRLIGHDTLSITKKYDPKYPYFIFSMLKPAPAVSVDWENPSETATIMHGEYAFEVIRRPVWIPTTDQIQEILLRSGGSYLNLLKQFAHYTEYHNSYMWQDKTKDQLWLEYFVWIKFSLVWQYVEKEWVIYTGKLSEA